MLVLAFISLCLITSGSSTICHSCLDHAILPFKSKISELNFRQLSKLPSCSDPETKSCFVGCYELKVEIPSIPTAFLRTCANDRIISKMRPNGTNAVPERKDDSVVINGYMCTLDKCNDKFGKQESSVPLSPWIIIFGISISLALACSLFAFAYYRIRNRGRDHYFYEGVSNGI